MTQHPPVRIPALSVAAIVAKHYGFTLDHLRSASRRKALFEARAMAVYAIRELCGHMNYSSTGRLLGGRDHTTILSAVKRADKLVQSEKHAAILAKVRAEVQADNVNQALIWLDEERGKAAARIKELDDMRSNLDGQSKVAV